MNKRQHTDETKNSCEGQRTYTKHNIQLSLKWKEQRVSQSEIRFFRFCFFREPNDWHRKSCHSVQFFAEKKAEENVPEMKSDIKRTNFSREIQNEEALHQTCWKRVFIRTRIVLYILYILFSLAMWYSNFLHCFRYYCHDSLSLSIQFDKIQHSAIVFFSVALFHRLSFICLYAVWMRWRRPFDKVIILSHYGYGIKGFLSLLISFRAKQAKQTIFLAWKLAPSKKIHVIYCVHVYTGIDKCAVKLVFRDLNERERDR